jgi:hypothetical protein
MVCTGQIAKYIDCMQGYMTGVYFPIEAAILLFTKTSNKYRNLLYCHNNIYLYHCILGYGIM